MPCACHDKPAEHACVIFLHAPATTSPELVHNGAKVGGCERCMQAVRQQRRQHIDSISHAQLVPAAGLAAPTCISAAVAESIHHLARYIVAKPVDSVDGWRGTAVGGLDDAAVTDCECRRRGAARRLGCSRWLGRARVSRALRCCCCTLLSHSRPKPQHCALLSQHAPAACMPGSQRLQSAALYTHVSPGLAQHFLAPHGSHVAAKSQQTAGPAGSACAHECACSERAGCTQPMGMHSCNPHRPPPSSPLASA